ncbi:TLD domain-containing protein 1 [Spatholobus suberectus]|nr:TLD domain-containing protein 1 [Spatholobus suberectus]
MGASTSAEPRVSAEQKEAEAVAASTGALPMLQKAFSKLANPETNAVPLENLQQCFSFPGERRAYSGSNVPDSFPALFDPLGSCLVDQFFVPDKGGISWVEFVRGYNKCCARVSASISLNMLVRVFVAVSGSANVAPRLEFESGDADCKINGHLLPGHVFLLLSLCWVVSWGSRNLKGEGNLGLPDLNHLVLSACARVEGGLNVWDCDVSSLEVQLPAGKFVTWVMSTVPCLPDCLRQYFHARLQMAETDGVELASSNSSSIGDISSIAAYDYILTQGRAWAISITQKSTVNEEISRAFISNGGGMDDKLVYRSSTHGRGLGRFWSHVEGYKGPLLILIAASSGDAHEGNSIDRKWVIGVLTDQGFENKDIFYGNSGCLYSIGPVFHAFPPTGKEKNFVYSHLHPTGKVYQPRPKPIGVAFGGTLGNERIFIDEDFAKVTVRHHAIDKTYQSGSLLPDQGFLPVEGLISEVEVWGLGGKVAKEVQNSYKKREELFTEQRRKVDLKTFASWEDSPEKMMMDMMADPNAVRKEDR